MGRAFQRFLTARKKIELWIPSPPTATQELPLGPPINLAGGVSLQFIEGGKGGRIFQMTYRIGNNANLGQGSFVFRFDYMDYTKNPSFYNPHVHIEYDNVNINHGRP